MGSRTTWVAAGVNQSESLGTAVLQDGRDARRGSQRLGRARNLDGLCSFRRISNQHRRGGKRQRRQHECNRANHRLVRILAAGHGARRQATAVMVAIRLRIGIGRRSLPVMMLGNVAVIPRAASHRVAHPSGTGQRRIQQRHGQQTHAGSQNSVSGLGGAVHKSSRSQANTQYYSHGRAISRRERCPAFVIFRYQEPRLRRLV
jgi:hypothetical protein